MQFKQALPLIDYNIIIADSDVIACQRLQHILNQQGATVDICYTGYDCRQRILQQDYDVLLLSSRLSDIPVLELLKQLDIFFGAIVGICSQNEIQTLKQMLKLGVCDTLIRPLVDLNEVTDTILTSNLRVGTEKHQLELLEFEDHRQKFAEDDTMASLVLQQMLPESPIEFVGYLCHYQLRGQSLLPIVHTLDDQYFVFVLIDICLLGEQQAFASVVIQGLLHRIWADYQQETSDLALQPELCLEELGKAVQQAKIKAPVSCLYVVVERHSARFSNAGMLDLSAPFDAYAPGFALGMFPDIPYICSEINIEARGLRVRFSNAAEDRLSLRVYPA